jgi:HEPN domain-containing protein
MSVLAGVAVSRYKIVYSRRVTDQEREKMIEDARPMAFLNMARQYHAAAEHLFELRGSLNNPVYHLYFHTAELALKAFLESHNVRTKKTHLLTELYVECRTHGLVIGTDDRTQLSNVMTMLENGNEYQGFRYFNPESRFKPELGWTREVVSELMKVVEHRVEEHAQTKPKPPTYKFDFIMGKPVPKDTPSA